VEIEAPHIRKWMEEHGGARLATSLSTEFERYLDTWPWAPSRLDWRSIDHVEFDMVDPWEDALVEFAGSTPLGRHENVMLMYSPSEPSLLSPTGAALRDLDLIYSASYGAKYICGVDVINGAPVLSCGDFAEFDGYSKVFFRVY